jgi:putative copper resistance protein D
MQNALILCRFLHFAALLLLFGTLLFRGWLFRPLLLNADTASLDKRLNTLLRWLAPLSLVSALLWLMLTTGNMLGTWHDSIDPQSLVLVLSNTFFGQVWNVHLLLNVLLVFGLFMPRLGSPPIRLALASLLLVTLAPVGHGAMFDGVLGDLMMLNQWVHLCSIGAWLGGLLLLLLLLTPPTTVDLRCVLLRFSGIGYGLVSAIIVTGLINVRVLSGALWPEPAFSGFGLILLIKVCLVGCMLLLALFNRLLLNHHIIRFSLLRTSVAFECLFGMAAVAAVSLLGTLPPMDMG